MVIPVINPRPPPRSMNMHLQEPRRAGQTTPRAAPPEPTLSDQRCTLPPGDPGFFPPGPLFTTCEKAVLKGGVGAGDCYPSSFPHL